MNSPPDRRIVAGVDGSASSRLALHWALGQAAATGSRVQALSCWEVPAGAAGLAVYEDVDLSRPTRELAEGAVEEARQEQQAEVEVEVLVVEGYPARVLTEVARDAELLVVGSRGHGTLSGLLLGSVGLHCASHAACPVVIVRRSGGASG